MTLQSAHPMTMHQRQAAMVARYGWAWDDWDRLAAGIVCGHLLECTGQVVGGNSLALIDRIDAGDLARLGYPIGVVEDDGTFVITKTPHTPGRVTLETVKEQLLYEIHDPARYLTPDVIADFTTLRLHDDGVNRVRVTGVTGHPRPDMLKLNMARLEGWSPASIIDHCLPAMKAGLNFIRLATPTTDDKRLPAVLANTSGFVYYVSITGITGSGSADTKAVGEAVARIKRHTRLPVCVGFGIRTPDAARAIAENANGAVVGTALVDALKGSLDADGRATARTVSAVADLVSSLAQGVRSARQAAE